MGSQHTLYLASGDTVVIVASGVTIRVRCHKMDGNWSLLLQYRADGQSSGSQKDAGRQQSLRGRSEQPEASPAMRGAECTGQPPFRPGPNPGSGQPAEDGEIRQTDRLSLIPAKGVFGQMVPSCLLTARETARALHISERTLYGLTKSGSIKAVRFGRAVRYDPDAVKQWVEQHSKIRRCLCRF